MGFCREERGESSDAQPARTVVLGLTAVNDNNNNENDNDYKLSRPPPPMARAYSPRAKRPQTSADSIEAVVGSSEDEDEDSVNSYKTWTRLSFEDDVDPNSFIGLECKIFWPLDFEWYYGRVVAYDSNTKTHQVDYEDGGMEHLILADERIRFRLNK